MSSERQSGRNGLTYKSAGVDIEAGDALVRRIAPAAKATRRRGTNAELGGFGGLFDLADAGFKVPVLVASTDGVGTKLKIAIETRRFGGIGQDLVAMCVNDIVVQGAEPLFFLDYYASGKLDVDSAATVIEGIADACRQSGCALIGGETAEMPGLYAQDDFDLAGFVVGAVEREKILPRTSEILPGDVIIGVTSSGLHSNGFSLVRHIVADGNLPLEGEAPFAKGSVLAEALLVPTTLYVKSALAAIAAGGTKALAHITGGGITENLPRVLPHDVDADINLAAWELPAVFGWLSRSAPLSEAEMLRTFNCGMGLIVVAAADAAHPIITAFRRAGENATVIGGIVEGNGPARVRYSGRLQAA